MCNQKTIYDYANSDNYTECIEFLKAYLTKNNAKKADEWPIVFAILERIFELSEGDEEKQRQCVSLLEQVINRVPIGIIQLMPLSWLLQYTAILPEDLCQNLLEFFRKLCETTIYQGVSDKSVLSTVYRYNPTLFENIIKRIPKTYFGYHAAYYNEADTGLKKRVYVTGMELSNNPELFEIIKKLRPDVKWTLKQQWTMDDVLLATYCPEATAGSKSYRGFQIKTLYSKNELLVPRVLAGYFEKIPECNINEHKTPDWIVFSPTTQSPIMTVEVKSSDGDDLAQMVREAIKHGDDKEIGWKYYANDYGLDDSIIKCAVLVLGTFNNKYANMSDTQLTELLSEIKIGGTEMDCFLLLISDKIKRTVRCIPLIINHDKLTYDKLGELLNSNIETIDNEL